MPVHGDWTAAHQCWEWPKVWFHQTAADEPIRARQQKWKHSSCQAGTDHTLCCCCCWIAVEFRHSCQNGRPHSSPIMLPLPFICSSHLQQHWPLFRKYVGMSSKSARRLQLFSKSADVCWSSNKVCFSCQTSYELSLTHHLVFLAAAVDYFFIYLFFVWWQVTLSTLLALEITSACWERCGVARWRKAWNSRICLTVYLAFKCNKYQYEVCFKGLVHPDVDVSQVQTSVISFPFKYRDKNISNTAFFVFCKQRLSQHTENTFKVLL